VPVDTILLLRVGLAPLLMVAVTVVARRWGAEVSGLLVGLPLTSGPIVLLLSLEHGTHFGSQVALATLIGLIGVSAFCVGYGSVAGTFPWYWATLIGWIAYGVAAWSLARLAVSVAPLLMIVTMTLVASYAVLPRKTTSSQPSKRGSWEIPLRMLTAMLMVLSVTGLAGVLGARWSGVLSPFPAYATITTAFTHQAQGSGEAILVLRGILIGSLTFAVFFAIVALTLDSLGIGAAFGSALLAACMTHSLLFLIMKRMRV